MEQDRTPTGPTRQAKPWLAAAAVATLTLSVTLAVALGASSDDGQSPAEQLASWYEAAQPVHLSVERTVVRIEAGAADPASRSLEVDCVELRAGALDMQELAAGAPPRWGEAADAIADAAQRCTDGDIAGGIALVARAAEHLDAVLAQVRSSQ